MSADLGYFPLLANGELCSWVINEDDGRNGYISELCELFSYFLHALLWIYRTGENDIWMKTILCSVMLGSEFSFLYLLVVTISVIFFHVFQGSFSSFMGICIYGTKKVWFLKSYYFPFGNGARAFTCETLYHWGFFFFLEHREKRFCFYLIFDLLSLIKKNKSVCVHVCVRTQAAVCMWQSEDNSSGACCLPPCWSRVLFLWLYCCMITGLKLLGDSPVSSRHHHRSDGITDVQHQIWFRAFKVSSRD